MKRSIYLLSIIFVASILSGCITSASPTDKPVIMSQSQSMILTIKVFPDIAQYSWTIDGQVVDGATGSSFTYTPADDEKTVHAIAVTASYFMGLKDTYQWNVYYAEAANSIGSEGGTIEVIDTSSDIYKAKVEVPAGALSETSLVRISEGFYAPKLPEGYSEAGPCIYVSPIPISTAKNSTYKALATDPNSLFTIWAPYNDSDNDGLVDYTGQPVNSLSMLHLTADNVWESVDLLGTDTPSHLITIKAKGSEVGYFFPVVPYSLSDSGIFIYTIDGLDFNRTWSLSSKLGLEGLFYRVMYLKNAIFSMGLDSQIGLQIGDVYSYSGNHDDMLHNMSWHGDATKTPEVVKDLKKDIKDAYDKYTNPPYNKKFIIVTHSWGTVLAKLALEYSQIKPDLFITLSSPLGTKNVVDDYSDALFGQIKGANVDVGDAREIVEIFTDAQINNTYKTLTDPHYGADFVRWINYLDNGDLFSGPLPNAKNRLNKNAYIFSNRGSAGYNFIYSSLLSTKYTHAVTSMSQNYWDQWGVSTLEGESFRNKVRDDIIGVTIDSDGDGVVDTIDNCPYTPNDQADSNENGIGDVCEHPPVANAGPDQTVAPGAAVTLNGSGSTDPDNDIVSYRWEKTDGPSVTPTNGCKSVAQFTADVADGSVLTFELTVKDLGGLQSKDTCVITVSNDSDNDGLYDVIEAKLGTNPFDADTDDDGILDGQEDINHDGYYDIILETDPNSIDTDGDGIQDGTEIGITMEQIGPDTNTAIFQPDLDPETTTNALSADTDHDGISDGVEDANHNGMVDAGENDPNTNIPPVSEAGPSQTVTPGTIVTLNGTGSNDPENHLISYYWRLYEGPAVTLSDPYAVSTQFDSSSIPSGSTLTFELTVADAGGLISTDTCTITISGLSEPITALLNSMVYIPGGTFMMGSTDNEYGWAQYTTPVHTVTVPAFDIGAYEVTQAQYLAVMGGNPSYFQGTSYPNSENNPVETVSWYDARAFCTALSALTGRTFTLPSEAQWEYACRAGTITLYSYGDSDALLGNYAWWYSNSGLQTHPVGTKFPNNWGLYDMMGNVWEWCLDSLHTNYLDAPTDGSAWEPETGSYRLLRGGSWYYDPPGYFRSAYRWSHDNPDSRDYNHGFRVVEIPMGNLNNGLVAYYPFNGNANDMSGNGNNGVGYNGVTYAGGVFGLAASFDGVDDFVRVPMSLRIQYPLTVSMCVNPTVNDFWSSDNSIASGMGYNNTDNKFYFKILTSNNPYTSNPAAFSSSDNEWHHVVWVYDGVMLKGFVDGNEAVSVPRTGSLLYGQFGQFDDTTIGSYCSGPPCGLQSSFKGLIDEVRIYNRALSEAEIQQLATK